MTGNGHLGGDWRSQTATGEQRSNHRDSGGIQLYWRNAAHGLASAGNRARREGIRPDGIGRGEIEILGVARPPSLLETSHPGVFAAGDVRSGSVKRVASAVGEGAMSVQFVHEYLKEM